MLLTASSIRVFVYEVGSEMLKIGLKYIHTSVFHNAYTEDFFLDLYHPVLIVRMAFQLKDQLDEIFRVGLVKRKVCEKGL